MRMRRSNNNGGGKFRRGPRKPNRMEGLPADEPDIASLSRAGSGRCRAPCRKPARD